ncbi:alcohol dehydrogenase yqhd [Anaeramoeba flamelloides]|uniref:Alcohol dehydrogenase yqhd n=1 Tax=Anaeramoeba flamelloides TaxID=1746091 RepID=A0ABQ8YRA3_9EUKA|nr:alcohol dehydrogenase yqhd [Anaeramoeba flamelloides]
MQNFNFYNPVNVVFGKNTITPTLRKLIKPSQRILITYGGGSIFKNGVYDQVIKGLEGNGHKIYEYGGITPNPRYKHGLEAIEICRKKDVNFILSVGGGSVLDCTKFIAAAAHHRGSDPWDVFSKQHLRENRPYDPIPFGDVITLPATGSEMNKNSVMSRHSTGEKICLIHPSMFPKFSILDPETTLSLPWRQTRNGIVDTFIHTIEAYVCQDNDHPVTDRLSEGLIKNLRDVSYRLLKNPNDYGARASLFWASSLALAGLTGCGLCTQDWGVHEIGHSITAHSNTDHAQTLATVLPGYWKHQKSVKLDKLAMYAENVWGINKGSKSYKADVAIDKTVRWFEDIKMPITLSEAGVKPKDIPHIAEQTIKISKQINKCEGIGQSKTIFTKDIEDILKLCRL